jgi:hypothetical protein
MAGFGGIKTVLSALVRVLVIQVILSHLCIEFVEQ